MARCACRALDQELPPGILDCILVANQRALEMVIHERCLHYNDERAHPKATYDRRHPAAIACRLQVDQIGRRTCLNGLISDHRQPSMPTCLPSPPAADQRTWIIRNAESE